MFLIFGVVLIINVVFASAHIRTIMIRETGYLPSVGKVSNHEASFEST